MTATRLFLEAERCYRLARGIAGPDLSEELEEIAREFERAARLLARDSTPERPLLAEAAD